MMIVRYPDGRTVAYERANRCLEQDGRVYLHENDNHRELLAIVELMPGMIIDDGSGSENDPCMPALTVTGPAPDTVSEGLNRP